MKAFREEVTADAEQRGLRRPRLSGRVNLHNREVTIDPVEPPAVARPAGR